MRSLKGSRTLPCASSVVNKRRVKWSSGQLVLAGVTDVAIGITDGNPYQLADGTYRVAMISPKTEDGVSITAADTIGVGVTCYGAANGMVSVSSANSAVVVGTNWAANVTANADADVQLATVVG